MIYINPARLSFYKEGVLSVYLNAVMYFNLIYTDWPCVPPGPMGSVLKMCRLW